MLLCTDRPRTNAASHSARDQATTRRNVSVFSLTLLYIRVGRLHSDAETQTSKVHQLWSPCCHRTGLPRTCHRYAARTRLEQDRGDAGGARCLCYVPTAQRRSGPGGDPFQHFVSLRCIRPWHQSHCRRLSGDAAHTYRVRQTIVRCSGRQSVEWAATWCQVRTQQTSLLLRRN